MKKRRHDGERARWYEIREGVWYKSYTTVLSMMPSSKWFVKWLKEHTAEEAETLLNDAGLQGSKIHNVIDLVLKGEIVVPSGVTDEQVNGLLLHETALIQYLKHPFTEREDTMMRGFFNFVKDYKLKVIHSEMTVWSDKIKCAGTLDCLCEIELPIDGKKVKKLTKKQKEAGKILEEQKTKKVVVVIDWKSGKNIYDSHYRQVAGYYKALVEMIRRKQIKVKRPKKAFILHLGVNNCRYKLIEVEDINKEYKKFCRVNEEWNDANSDATPDEVYEFMDEYKINAI